MTEVNKTNDEIPHLSKYLTYLYFSTNSLESQVDLKLEKLTKLAKERCHPKTVKISCNSNLPQPKLIQNVKIESLIWFELNLE